jgi:hypothetical protein
MVSSAGGSPLSNLIVFGNVFLVLKICFTNTAAVSIGKT